MASTNPVSDICPKNITNPDFYEEITDLIGQFRRNELNILNNMYNVIDELNAAPQDFLAPYAFEYAGTVGESATDSLDIYFKNTSLLDKIVVRIQKNIITHYGAINDFLSNKSILVDVLFAQLSNELGYSIDDANIDYEDSILGLVKNNTIVVPSTVSGFYVELISTNSGSATLELSGVDIEITKNSNLIEWNSAVAVSSHVFTSANESISDTIGGTDYNIKWISSGDLILNITKV
jgi:hypothetical protein